MESLELSGPYIKVMAMTGNNIRKWGNARESYFFYFSLVFVIGMALFGIVREIATIQ